MNKIRLSVIIKRLIFFGLSLSLSWSSFGQESESPKFLNPKFFTLRYSEGKILVSGKSLEKIPSHQEIEIGEEIISVNGISMSDFNDECAFVNWHYRFSEDKIFIITKSGENLCFERMPLPSSY